MTFSIYEEAGKTMIILIAALILMMIGGAMTYEFIKLDKEGISCISNPLEYKEIKMNQNDYQDPYVCSCDRGKLDKVWVTNGS